jgi:putative membrane protein
LAESGSLISEYERAQIAQAIAEVERHTDAELVTVLTARSDDYRYLPVLWAAACALLISAPLVFAPLSVFDVVSIQLGLFCVLILTLRIPDAGAAPDPTSRWALARGQHGAATVPELGLHHTDAETGVLIFVSEAERYVEILADRGVSNHVDNALAVHRRSFRRRREAEADSWRIHRCDRCVWRNSDRKGAEDEGNQ